MEISAGLERIIVIELVAGQLRHGACEFPAIFPVLAILLMIYFITCNLVHVSRR